MQQIWHHPSTRGRNIKENINIYIYIYIYIYVVVLTCGLESPQWFDVVVQQSAPAVLAEGATAATWPGLLGDCETSPRRGLGGLLL